MDDETAKLGNSFLAVFAVLSLVAGLFIHYAVEKPFLILKNRV